MLQPDLNEARHTLNTEKHLKLLMSSAAPPLIDHGLACSNVVVTVFLYVSSFLNKHPPKTSHIAVLLHPSKLSC